jgi:hypothetical protein
MYKLNLTTCKICGVEKTSRGFSQHIKRAHGINLMDYIIKHEFNNNIPECKCGCGNQITIRGYAIMDYIDGYCPTGQFKTGATPTRDYTSWINKLTEGIRNYNKNSKITNPSYRSGINNNFYGKHHSDKSKQLIRDRVEEQISSGNHAFLGNANGRIGKSSLEKKFEDFLIQYNVPYIHNYKIKYIPEGKSSYRYKYYDFYIPELNKLIEIHGSYWHPRTITDGLSKMQISNYYNDIFKKDLASNSGFLMDIVYDTDLAEYIDCFYTVYGERKDVDKLIVEF